MKGYSATDHLVTLHSVIDYLRYRKKKLFCTFIDFSKAFDQVWRSGLWFKVINLGISSKCFNVIFNMYQNIKSCVESFYCQSGVRQGVCFSPLLFAIFINDLENCLNTEQ